MKKFLIFCLIVAVLVGAVYYLYENTDLFDDLIDELFPQPSSTRDDDDDDDQKNTYEESCTVSFESNGGSACEDQTVENGAVLLSPPVPTRDGYAFVGWYTKNNYKTLFDFSAPITKSCTVYARWVDITDQTDSDGDGLTDPVEEYYGTNPLLADTDGDLLSDYVEIELLKLDPLKADTDGNGVIDGNEDSDGDTLLNHEEIALATNPALKDTDGDGLTDSEEIKVHQTDPTLEDTDSDGANDGWEIDNGFDPRSYNRTFDVTVKAEQSSAQSAVTAQVQIQTNGEQASALTVTEVLSEENVLLTSSIPGYLGSAYDFSTVGQIDSAVITFEYETALGWISDDFQPRIYYFNETTGTLEELENQYVENGRISVTVTHFSKYILLNKVAFDKVWESEIKPPDYEGDKKTGIDIVFVIDSSGSMSSNDTNNLRHAAVIQFIEKLGEHDRGAVIDFDSSVSVYQTLTNDKNALISAVNRVNSSGGTNLSVGINAAINQLSGSSYTRTDAYKYVVFLTDGDGSYSSAYTAVAAQEGIVIYTIGLGSGVKETVLKNIANGTGGKYYFASQATSLPDIYDEVSFDTIDYSADTNNDGISDYYTKLIYDGILVLSNGSNQFAGIDFNYDVNGNLCDDYDGDGRKNSEELIIVELDNVVYMVMHSDPTKADSDGDGFKDNEDGHPLTWDVSDRDLAMLSQLIYCDEIASHPFLSLLDTATVNAVNKKFYGTASVQELKGWRLVYRFQTPYLLTDSGLCYGVFEKDNNIVIAIRGSVGSLLEPDWLNNFCTYPWTTDIDTELLLAHICDIVDTYQKAGYNLYITGHSRGGMLAQRATASLVENGYGNRITKLTYFNGIGIVFVKGLWGTGRTWFDNLESIAEKVTRYYIEGDVVDALGCHVTSRTPLSVSSAAKSNISFLPTHALCSFTYHLMPERFRSILQN